MKLLFVRQDGPGTVAYIDSKGPFSCSYRISRDGSWKVQVRLPSRHEDSGCVLGGVNEPGAVVTVKLSTVEKSIWAKGCMTKVEHDGRGNGVLLFKGPVLS